MPRKKVVPKRPRGLRVGMVAEYDISPDSRPWSACLIGEAKIEKFLPKGKVCVSIAGMFGVGRPGQIVSVSKLRPSRRRS